VIDTALGLFDEHVRPQQPHGNEKLHLRGMLGGLLAAAFQPAAWALRPIDDLSLHPRVQALTGMDRIARSTLSDAMARFDPCELDPVVQAIEKQLPQLERFDPAAAHVTRRIIASDGSWFNLAGQVTHALQCRRGNKGTQCRVRLNLQIDVDSFCPTDFDVSGKGDGNEAAAFMRSIQPQCIYLADRNFVSHAFINTVLAKDSNIVLRLKKGINFDVRTVGELTDEDRAHQVLRDETGILPGPTSKGNSDARSCTAAPTCRTMRRVTVWDEKNKREVILLTDILDVPAYVIAVLYRLRWQIELFLRWLKVLAGFEHLVSQSERGITMQFYIAVLMALLIHLQTGTRVSKYSLLWVSWLADGSATADAMAQAMARHERERENARRRRLAKKQAM
jgi:DDE family transposase